MKLDLDYLNFISKEEIRVLVSVELGMRNHEWVPMHLIEKISKMKRNNAYKVIKKLLKQKLVTHTDDGYRVNYKGYDYLAINTLLRRGKLSKVMQKVGVGKESDIFLCQGPNGEDLILKVARLGRTSFRTVKNNRDYLNGRTQYSWLYLSRIASNKEFCYMQILHKNGFPTPQPIDVNRHAILMSYIDAYTMCKVNNMKDPESAFHECLDLLVQLAEHGLIHGDFNEFNLMINNAQKVFVIDFPQMVSIDHKDAEFYFQRDIKCIHTLFKRRYQFLCDRHHTLDEIEVVKHLDQEVRASGSMKKRDLKQFEAYMKAQALKEAESEGEEEEEEGEEGEEEEQAEGEQEDQAEGEEEEEQMEIKEDLAQEEGQEEDDVQGPVEGEEDSQNSALNNTNLTFKAHKKFKNENDLIKKSIRRKFRKKKQFRANKNKTKLKPKVDESYKDPFWS